MDIYVIQGPIEHSHRLEEVLDAAAPNDADIWFEATAVLKEMEESSTGEWPV